jgi:hypothetical protein
MATFKLGEQIRKNEQRKARTAEIDAELRIKQRKARNGDLMSAGGLVEKVGLLKLDLAARYGALLSLQDGISNAKTVEQWGRKGTAALAQESAERESRREALAITYPDGAEILANEKRSLRAAGFKYVPFIGQWCGELVDPEVAVQLAALHEGVVRRKDGSLYQGGERLSEAAE